MSSLTNFLHPKITDEANLPKRYGWQRFIGH